MSDETPNPRPQTTPQPTGKIDIKRNLYSNSWVNIQWNSQQTLESLEEIRKYVEYEVVKAIHWYLDKKRKKVWYSQWLRMLAVLFGGIGAAIPFIAATGLGREATVANDLQILRINQWGYVFIIAATTCVAIDKLFGFSSNWIRFVDAATKMETLLGKFRLEWYRQLALADISGQNRDTINKLFDTMLDFTMKTREVIEKETGDWIVEFRSNLTKLSEDTKASQEAREKQIQQHVDQLRQAVQERQKKSGAVTVTVTNFGALGAGFSWSLELDNESRKAHIDRPTFIVKDLDPGAYLVAAYGMAGNKIVEAAQTIQVETGKSAMANLELK